MSSPKSEPRHLENVERWGTQHSHLDQMSLPLVLTVEEAADRLGVGRTLMYALVSSGAVESTGTAGSVYLRRLASATGVFTMPVTQQLQICCCSASTSARS